MKRKDRPQDRRSGSRRSRRRRAREAQTAAIAPEQQASTDARAATAKAKPVLAGAPQATPGGPRKLRRRVLRRPDPPSDPGPSRRPENRGDRRGRDRSRDDAAGGPVPPRREQERDAADLRRPRSPIARSARLDARGRELPLVPPGALDPEAPRGRRQRRFRLARTLYIYLGVEVVRIALLSCLAISLIGTIVLAFQLTRNGIRIGFLWPILQKSLAYPLYFSVPISLLFGITLAVGRMASDLEVMAMRANGLSYRQIAAPILIFSILLTAGALYVNGDVIPKIHYAKGNLREAILAQLESLGSGKNRSLLLPGQVRLFVEEYSGTQFRGIKLELQEETLNRLREKVRNQLITPLPSRAQGTSLTVLARSCDLEISADRREMYLNLQRVEILIPEPMRGSSESQRNEVFRQKPSLRSLRLPLTFLERSERVKDRSWSELLRHRDELASAISTLETKIGELEEQKRSESSEKSSLDSTVTRGRIRSLGQELEGLRRRSHRADTEVYRRGSFSLACFTFPFVGLPLVLLTDRRSRLVPFFVGNVFVVLPFFLLVMLGVLLGERGLPPLLTLAPANLVLLAFGAHLWRRAVRM